MSCMSVLYGRRSEGVGELYVSTVRRDVKRQGGRQETNASLKAGSLQPLQAVIKTLVYRKVTDCACCPSIA